jgi:hypothetical protein
MSNTKKTLREYNDALYEQEDRMFSIEFDNPTQRQKHETKYKFLSQESDMFFFITECQNKLKHSGIRFNNNIPPCVTIDTKDNELFNKRVQFLQEKEIDVFNPENYKMIGAKKFVMCLPKNEELGLIDPYIIIAQISFLSNKDRFLKVILNEKYTTENNWEYTVFD